MSGAPLPLTDRAHNRVFRYESRTEDGTELPCVGKFYERAEDALRVSNVLRALGGAVGVTTPRVIAYDAERRFLLVTYEAGEALTPALAADNGPVAAAIGRALAALHASPVMVDRVTRASAVLDDVRSRVAELRSALPGTTRRLPWKLSELERDLPSDPLVLSFVHGDFGPANLLWNGRDIVVLDFDRCTRGDPALDLGTLFTQLRRSALRSPGRFPNFGELRARVLDAYGGGRTDPALDARVAWYERAVLIRKIHSLALDTTRHARPDRIHERRAEAFRLLEDGHAPA